MDLDKLTPAPWKAVMVTVRSEVMIDKRDRQFCVAGGEYKEGAYDFGNFLDRVAECSWTRGKYEYEQANAEFIALARNAFDVMMRRGWGVKQYGDGWRPFMGAFNFNSRLLDWMNSLGDEPDSFSWPDPFTALVEADKWYKEHIDGPGTDH